MARTVVRAIRGGIDQTEAIGCGHIRNYTRHGRRLPGVDSDRSESSQYRMRNSHYPDLACLPLSSRADLWAGLDERSGITEIRHCGEGARGRIGESGSGDVAILVEEPFRAGGPSRQFGSSSLDRK